jgi:ParB-like nuclease domain
MLSEAELWDLAADIAEHGQLDPILVNSDGEILDGRQREAACRLVGIEPQVSAYPGRPVCTRKIRGDADTPDHGPTGDGHGDPAE